MATKKPSRMLAVWAVVSAALLAPCISFAQHATFVFNDYLVSPPGFTLPFHLFDGHMLIDGAVNGRRGKFMFDTGTEFPFFLNNHFLSLSRDQFVGQGHAGSGQEMVLYRQNAPVSSIEIAGQVRFENVTALIHTDWGFIEEAYTPHFLGSIGLGFNRNYLFLIDYDAQTIVFHALSQDEDVLSRVIDPARVIATLPFTPVGVDGKMPELELHIGDETLTTFFDTGSAGTLELTETMKSRLERQGSLTLTASDYAYGAHEPHVRGTLKGLSHGSQALEDARNLNVRVGTANRLGLGYHFLKHYVSAWDYKRRTLTLLRP
jgi:hypothetical protein